MGSLSFDSTPDNSDFIRKADAILAKTKAISKHMEIENEKIRSYDTEILKFCDNLDNYFDGLLNKINAVSTMLQSTEVNIGLPTANTGNASALPHDELRSKNAEITEQLRAQKEEIKQQQIEWSGLADTIKSNNVEAREQLMAMRAAGMQNTLQYQKTVQELGNMHKQMILVNAEMEFMANPDKGLSTLKEGLQGVASGAGLAADIMGLFNQNNEKMAEIQSKVQSLLGIVINLEGAYGMVKKSNTVMLAIEHVQRKALVAAIMLETQAKTGNIALTWASVAAQKAFNLVANANPYVLLATGILTVVGGIALLISANKENTAEQERANMAAR